MEGICGCVRVRELSEKEMLAEEAPQVQKYIVRMAWFLWNCETPKLLGERIGVREE